MDSCWNTPSAVLILSDSRVERLWTLLLISLPTCVNSLLTALYQSRVLDLAVPLPPSFKIVRSLFQNFQKKKEIRMARSALKGYSEYWSTLLMFYEDSCCVIPAVLHSFLGTMPSPLCNRLGAITWKMLAILYIWYLELASLMVYGHIYIDLSQSEVIIPILWHWNSMKNETPLMG